MPAVDDGHLAAHQLVLRDDHAQRRQGRRVVLDHHAVVDAEHAAVRHVPPAHGLFASQSSSVVQGAAAVLDVAAVLLLRRVRLEPLAVLEVLVRVRHDGDRPRRPSYVTVASRRTSPPLAWFTVQISKPSLLPRTMRDWRRPSRVERAVMTAVWAKTHEPRLLPPGKVIESS